MVKRILFTTFAVALAAAGTAGVGLYAQSADARALAGQKVVEAYVAVEPVPEGTSAGSALVQGLIEPQKLASRTVPARALRTVGDSVKDLVAASDVPAGSLVMKAVFTARDEADPNGLDIPAGKIAVSVQLEDPARVAGLIEPGSKVAVFDTFTLLEEGVNTPSGERLGSARDDVHGTRVVIPEATVLAIGQTTRPTSTPPAGGTSEGGVADSSTTADTDSAKLVTLVLTQAEAERLITVVQTGNPWFALLGDDSRVSNGSGVDTRRLFSYGGSE